MHSAHDGAMSRGSDASVLIFTCHLCLLIIGPLSPGKKRDQALHCAYGGSRYPSGLGFGGLVRLDRKVVFGKVLACVHLKDYGA